MSDIAVIEQDGDGAVATVTLFGSNEPDEVVARATKTANVLAEVVRSKGLSTNIKGREHVRVEGWTLLGTMLGVFPIVVWTREVGDGQGWEARVEARTRDGDLVGAAEAECLRSENTWRSRDSYALRSMAQTRATSKALRHPLGFVMSIAGFEATPEEEMPKDEPAAEPARPGVITGPQRKRLWAVAQENTVDEELLRSIVLEIGGVESTQDIPRDKYDAIIGAIQAQAVPFT